MKAKTGIMHIFKPIFRRATKKQRKQQQQIRQQQHCVIHNLGFGVAKLSRGTLMKEVFRSRFSPFLSRFPEVPGVRGFSNNRSQLIEASRLRVHRSLGISPRNGTYSSYGAVKARFIDKIYPPDVRGSLSKPALAFRPYNRSPGSALPPSRRGRLGESVYGGRETGDGGWARGDGGQRTADWRRRTGNGGRRTGDGGRRTGEGGRRTVNGGRRTFDGGRLTGDGGRRKADRRIFCTADSDLTLFNSSEPSGSHSSGPSGSQNSPGSIQSSTVFWTHDLWNCFGFPGDVWNLKILRNHSSGTWKMPPASSTEANQTLVNVFAIQASSQHIMLQEFNRGVSHPSVGGAALQA
ncbi:unnamed protein product [Nesidiocoris tenuis]|uniref:Uncharacterized protein n=1 Tax=Nesidiocoris tenuis TaxID=355587 RepID=A0A6H5GEI9_9HEMI|nr:unnamed protein product [Nesidiocoris tenuis]